MIPCIVGWSHTSFGKHLDDDVESLVVRAARAALTDAGLGASEVDEIFLGQFNAGLDPQEFPSSLVLQADDAFRFKPSTRVENACASGSAAIYRGLDSVAARRARFVLVVGVEKMTATTRERLGEALLGASFRKEEGKDSAAGFAGIFGQLAQSYFQRHGDQSEALAHIAAKNHRSGFANPLAHIRKDLGFEFCRHASEKNPVVAGPLKRTDCSPVSDGASAVVLADAETALAMDKAVVFRAAQQVNDFMPMSRRDPIRFDGCQQAWHRALDRSGLSLDDLSLVETHDCFTIAELIEYEAMGLVPHGKGAQAILEGWTERDGKLPVNPSGGLKAMGHPVGATGVSMHVLASMQLTATAEDIQVPGASLAGIFNMGGVAVANYVSILERLR